MRRGWLITAAILGAALPLHAAPPTLGEFTTGSSDDIVKAINTAIQLGWTDNEVQPSDVAEDTEWLRRVYLDIVGYAPPAEDVEKFLKDRMLGNAQS